MWLRLKIAAIYLYREFIAFNYTKKRPVFTVSIWSLVNITRFFDLNNGYGDDLVFDGINYPVITDPDAVAILSRGTVAAEACQFFVARRTMGYC